MNKLKILMVVLMGAVILLITQQSYNARSKKINQIYSDIFFTRLAVETKQYTRQIEYGIKNGKTLDNFYNIQSILSDVRKCSSYIKGMYIISKDSMIMYSISDDESRTPQRAKLPNDGSLYSVDANGDSYIMAVPIYDRTNEAAGYMLLDLAEEAVTNSVADIHRDNLTQSIMVSVLTFLAGTVFIIHMCRRKETVLVDCARTMSVTVCAGMFIDSAISAVKLKLTLDNLIQHSVSKIVMSLQNTLNEVTEKGVAISRIYDLNSWLVQSCQPIPFLDNLIYDKGYRISAIVNNSYAMRSAAGYILLGAEIIGICAAAFLAVSVAFVFVDKLNNKPKQVSLNTV